MNNIHIHVEPKPMRFAPITAWSLKYRELINANNAYNLCLNMERNLEEKIGISGEDVDQNERNLMYCRVLGHPIQYAPRDQVVVSIASDIVLCQND